MDKKWLSALKPLVNNQTQWKAFEEMIDFYVLMKQNTLEQSSDPQELYRSQGAIAALKRLKKLRDEVNAEG